MCACLKSWDWEGNNEYPPQLKQLFFILICCKEGEKNQRYLGDNWEAFTTAAPHIEPMLLELLGYQGDAGSSATQWATNGIYPAAPPLFLLQAAVIKARMVSWLVSQSQLCLQHGLTFAYWL